MIETDPTVGLRFNRVEAPMILCSETRELLATTRQAKSILTQAMGVVPTHVPSTLWAALEQQALGKAVEWRPLTAVGVVIGCTRYRAPEGYLLLMKEVTAQRAASSESLHAQRLEAMGRLVASIAHEIRNSVAAIVYSADLLRIEDVTEAERSEIAEEILGASRQLQEIVDGLLDYARLGPTLSVPVSIRDVLTRAQGFLRAFYRDGAHTLIVNVSPTACWAQGNSIVVEQVFVNLLLNAAEAAGGSSVTVIVEATLAPLPGGAPDDPFVRVRVVDDGARRPHAFESGYLRRVRHDEARGDRPRSHQRRAGGGEPRRTAPARGCRWRGGVQRVSAPGATERAPWMSHRPPRRRWSRAPT